MRKLTTKLSTWIVLCLLIGMTSCQSDETIFNRIVGNTWIGDLRFGTERTPLESGVYFGADGFGTDELYTYDGNQPIEVLKINWSIEDNILYINYGNVSELREIRNLFVSSRSLTGDLYIDRKYIGDVTLMRSTR